MWSGWVDPHWLQKMTSEELSIQERSILRKDLLAVDTMQSLVNKNR